MSGLSRTKDAIAGVVEVHKQKLTFNRTVIVEPRTQGSYFHSPIKGSHELVTYKALLRRSANFYSVKVGVFGSQGRTGQGLQAVGTALLPGDTSLLRSPTRSGVYSALTPGGIIPGVGMSPSRESRGYRCPEGFQYGGRFTDSRFSTCGQMLFDIFPLGAVLGQLLKPPVAPMTTQAAAGGSISPIPGLSARDQQIIISRAAQIPKIGVANPAKQKIAVDSARNALSSAEDGVTLMVRRDGFALRPVVSTAILRTVPDNRNMEGAVFLVSAKTPKSLGGEEMGLLSNTGVAELNYVGKNNTLLSLRKTRPLTVGERRRLGRLVAKIVSGDPGDDPTSKLQQISATSNGAIEYRENFGSINNPNDLITVKLRGVKKQVRRWVYENFLRDESRKLTPKVTEETTSSEPIRDGQITSLAAAIKHLETGGDPRKIIASLLPTALQRASSYSSMRDGKKGKLHTRRGWWRIYEHSPAYDFEHVNARVSSDIQQTLGLKSPQVMFMGGGRRQPYFSVDKMDTDFDIKPADNLDNIEPAQILAMAMSDYITDNRSRSPQTTQIVVIDGKRYIRSADNSLTFLAGIPKKIQASRLRKKPDEVFDDSNADMYRKYFAELTDQQRRLVLTQIDRLLKRLTEFSWDEYIQRLNIDGKLSSAEKTHLNIVRSIIDTRVETLKNSKAIFAKALF